MVSTLAQVIAPLLGILLISLALIGLSPSMNPSLHSFMHELLLQIQRHAPLEYLQVASLDTTKTVLSAFFLLSGFVLMLTEGSKRLAFVVPLCVFFFYIVGSTIVHGLTLSIVPIYSYVLFSLLVVLFHDCIHLDELDS